MYLICVHVFNFNVKRLLDKNKPSIYTNLYENLPLKQISKTRAQMLTNWGSTF